MTITIKKGSLCGLIMVDVDSLDRAILSYLRDAARAPFVDIAKQVNVTERTVRTRMKRWKMTV